MLILLPAGSLLLIPLILLSNWIALEGLGRGGADANKALSWEDAYGAFRASESPPTTVRVSREPSTFSLPQVLSVEDAVETGSGWTLLDRRLGRLHLLHTESGLTRSLGREGEGPDLRRRLPRRTREAPRIRRDRRSDLHAYLSGSGAGPWVRMGGIPVIRWGVDANPLPAFGDGGLSANPPTPATRPGCRRPDVLLRHLGCSLPP